MPTFQEVKDNPNTYEELKKHKSDGVTYYSIQNKETGYVFYYAVKGEEAREIDAAEYDKSLNINVPFTTSVYSPSSAEELERTFKKYIAFAIIGLILNFLLTIYLCFYGISITKIISRVHLVVSVCLLLVTFIHPIFAIMVPFALGISVILNLILLMVSFFVTEPSCRFSIGKTCLLK